MLEPTVSPLSAWESFYVIVGSSGGALTGLQFVVVTLGAEARSLKDTTVAAFGTPTVVHFCSVLLLSAILSAPWHELSGPDLLVGLLGAAGLLYAVIVMRRAVRQSGYQPVAEDWIWHGVLPFVAYGALLVAAFLLSREAARGLFVIGASAVLLLFIGIHNAWDAVTYIAVEQSRKAGS